MRGGVRLECQRSERRHVEISAQIQQTSLPELWANSENRPLPVCQHTSAYVRGSVCVYGGVEGGVSEA